MASATERLCNSRTQSLSCLTVLVSLEIVLEGWLLQSTGEGLPSFCSKNKKVTGEGSDSSVLLISTLGLRCVRGFCVFKLGTFPSGHCLGFMFGDCSR